MDILQEVSGKIIELFVANKKRYAKQLDDGNYKSVRKNITPVKIYASLCSQGSIMTYQEFNGFLKWICLDFDIKKGLHEDGNTERYYSELSNTVNCASDILTKNNIDHLLEFSGRRGFHIWIIFKYPIHKYEGYALAKHIQSLIGNIPDCLAIDLYPKTPSSNNKSKGIGLGVKLPLSVHKKSRQYSFLVKDASSVSGINELNDSILQEQLLLMNDYQLQDFSEVIAKLKITIENEESIRPYLNMKVIIDEEFSFEKILDTFKMCRCLEKIISKFELGMNSIERQILVGLFCRLKSKNDSSLGISLLAQLFSTLPDYDPNLTSDNFRLFKNYYPPTCDYLKRTLGTDCDSCPCHKQGYQSPIEILVNDYDLEVESSDPFSVTEHLFNKTVRAQIKYSYFNDEVPLYLNELYLQELLSEAYQYDYIKGKYINVLNGKCNDNNPIHNFIRNESKDKARDLVVLGHEDKVLTTFGMYHLHTLWAGEISTQSFGYQINPNFNSGYLFMSWLKLWCQYRDEIYNIIYEEDNVFDNYTLIKIDLQSFYDSIDLQRLSIKLTTGDVPETIKSLSESQKAKYDNLIKYLCDMCSRIGNQTQGVPQGPAFARYLAEIFMIGFDKLLTNKLLDGYEFFFRYVDDVFIFIKDSKRVELIESEITNYLAINTLQRNTSKSSIFKVSEFKKEGLFYKYLDETKYFIDQTYKHYEIATDEEIEKAISDAKKLLEHSKLGLKDHFRFILSHDLKDQDLSNKFKDIENSIIFSSNGRGDLYRAFFDNYYLEKNNLIPEEQIESLPPLVFENYINSLARKDNANGLSEYIINICANSKNKFSDTIKENIWHLALKNNIILPESFVKNEDYSIIKRVIECPLKYRVGCDVLGTIDFPLYFNNDDLEVFFVEIYKFVFHNQLQGDLLRELSMFFWKRVTEGEIEKSINKNFIAVYNLICLFSICIDLDQDLDNTNQEKDWPTIQASLFDVWESFIKSSSEIDNIENSFNSNWISLLEEMPLSEFSIGTLINCLTINKEGSQLALIEDQFGLIDKFKKVVAIIFCKDPSLLDRLKSTGSAEIEKLKKSDIFLDWALDRTSRLFPEDEGVCFLNVAFNGIIILRKGNSFFIKSLKADLCTDFEYIKDFVKLHDSKTIEIEKPQNTVEFDKYIDENTSVFRKLFQLLKIHHSCLQFSLDYKCNFPNYFYSKPLLILNGTSTRPLIPFFASVDHLITTDQVVKENNQAGFDKLFLEKMYSLQINLSIGPSFKTKLSVDASISLFPDNILTASDQLKFVKRIIDNLSCKQNFFSCHCYEKAWALALWTHMEETISENNELAYAFLEMYFSHHRNDDVKQLIFNAEGILDTKTLKDFYNALKSNITVSVVSDEIVKLEEILINNLNSINNLLELSTSIDKFILKDIQVDKQKVMSGSKYLVNGKSFSEDNYLYFIVNIGYESSIEELSDANGKILFDNRSRMIFTYEEDKKIVFAIVPRALEKAYKVLTQRTEWFKKITVETEFDLLWDYFNPINHNYGKVEEVASLLAPHYNGGENNIARRIVNWLLLYNPMTLKGSELEYFMLDKGYNYNFLYETILDVVLKHKNITESNMQKFKKYIDKRLDDSTFFSIKTLDDCNGTFQVLNHINRQREVKLDDCENNLTACNKENIVFLSDINISGFQTINALEYYFGNKKLSPKEIKEKKYHSISDIATMLKNYNKIIFLSVISTQAANSNITEYFKQYQELAEKVDCIHSRCITQECFGSIAIASPKRELFSVLLRDVELICEIFECDKRLYRKSIRSHCFDNQNMILRLLSTPKKGIKIFTLKPKNNNIEPLFEHRED